MDWSDEMNKIREKMMREFKKLFDIDLTNDIELDTDKMIELNQPLIYGYSIQIGPDGVPIIKEFGNVKPQLTEKTESVNKFEPYIDSFVNKENNEIVVTAEIPGVDKEDLSVKASGKKLFIKSKTKGREFNRTVELGSEVEPDTIKSVYNNGILEVKAKIIKEEDKSVDVKVE